jgi:hypothetical protein
MRSPHSTQPGVATAVRAFFPAIRAAAALLVAIVLLAGCGADQSTAPDDVSARFDRTRNAKLLSDFVNAQGTFCDRSIPRDCETQDELGIGYYVTYCVPLDCEGQLAMGIDFGGVNARWWARQPLPPFPSFKYDGFVSEKTLPDGRRKITANIWSRNTFVDVYSETQSSLVGANFFEYPSIAPPGASQLPLAGQTTIITEITLPLGFVGMPDMVQVLFYPEAGFEVTRLFLTGVVEGPLREDYNGIAAGTPVRVVGVFNEIPGAQAAAEAKAEREKPNKQHRRYHILDRINSRLTVTPLNRR